MSCVSPLRVVTSRRRCIGAIHHGVFFTYVYLRLRKKHRINSAASSAIMPVTTSVLGCNA